MAGATGAALTEGAGSEAGVGAWVCVPSGAVAAAGAVSGCAGGLNGEKNAEPALTDGAGTRTGTYERA
jgi:hypothetical protein